MKFRTQTKRLAQTSTGLAGRALRAMALGAGMLVSVVAWAGPSVTYSAFQDSLTGWHYDYTVTGPIDAGSGIDLVFDYHQFDTLLSSSTDSSISTVDLQPDPGLHFNGDVVASFANGLGDGSTSMFSVSFDWLGGG